MTEFIYRYFDFKVLSCQKNDGVKFINHGPALIKSQDGDITRKYFKDDVEIDIKNLDRIHFIISFV